MATLYGESFARQIAQRSGIRQGKFCSWMAQTELQETTKAVVGIHVLLTRSPFGAGIPRRLLLRVSLAKRLLLFCHAERFFRLRWNPEHSCEPYSPTTYRILSARTTGGVAKSESPLDAQLAFATGLLAQSCQVCD